jgi:hypothetical protein
MKRIKLEMSRRFAQSNACLVTKRVRHSAATLTLPITPAELEMVMAVLAGPSYSTTSRNGGHEPEDVGGRPDAG